MREFRHRTVFAFSKPVVSDTAERDCDEPVARLEARGKPGALIGTPDATDTRPELLDEADTKHGLGENGIPEQRIFTLEVGILGHSGGQPARRDDLHAPFGDGDPDGCGDIPSAVCECVGDRLAESLLGDSLPVEMSSTVLLASSILRENCCRGVIASLIRFSMSRQACLASGRPETLPSSSTPKTMRPPGGNRCNTAATVRHV